MKFPKKDIIVIVTWIISIIGFIIIVPKLFKFFEPVIIGAIISLIIYPIVRFLEKKLKIIKPIGIIVISALIIGILGIILYFIFGFISNEILLLVKNLPNIYDDFSNGLDEIIEYINSFAPNINGFNESMIIDANSLQLSLPSYDTILQYIQQFSDYIIDYLKNLPTLIINIIFICLFAIMFILNGTKIRENLSKLVSNKDENKVYSVFFKLKDILSGYVLAQIKLLGITFIIVFIGFLILGIPYSFIFALFVAILDMLPFFGTGTILCPYAIISFIYGDFYIGFGCLTIYAITFIIRRSLEPKLIGDSIGVSSLFSAFCMFIGYQTFGFIGFIFGVPIGVLLLHLYKLDFFKSLVVSIKNIIEYYKSLVF